jgi:hypothetical protein
VLRFVITKVFLSARALAYAACRNLVHQGLHGDTKWGVPTILLAFATSFRPSINISLVDFVCRPFRLNVDFGIRVEDSFIWLDNTVPGDRWLHLHNGQRHE